MRPTKPANPQPDDYEPVEQPEQKPKICPYCGREFYSRYSYVCGSPACEVEAIVSPLTRHSAVAKTISGWATRPCAGGCGRTVDNRWDKCAHCEPRHELEFEEGING